MVSGDFVIALLLLAFVDFSENGSNNCFDEMLSHSWQWLSSTVFGSCFFKSKPQTVLLVQQAQKDILFLGKARK